MREKTGGGSARAKPAKEVKAEDAGQSKKQRGGRKIAKVEAFTKRAKRKARRCVLPFFLSGAALMSWEVTVTDTNILAHNNKKCTGDIMCVCVCVVFWRRPRCIIQYRVFNVIDRLHVYLVWALSVF